MREIQPIGTPSRVIAAPGSKSVTNRAMVIAALAKGESRLKGVLRCEDTFRLVEAIRQIGFLVRDVEGGADLIVYGQGGVIPAHRASIRVGASGTALRFLTALLALGPGKYEVDGDGGLRARPVEPLCEALRSVGADVRASPAGGAPVRIRGGELTGGAVILPGSISSQFVSALLLIGPYLPWGAKVRMTGTVVSGPYLDLTIDLMRSFGVEVRKEGARRFHVDPGAYRAREFEIEGDATAASYFFAAAAVTGGRVRVTNLPKKSLQGDLVMLDLLEAMGATAARGRNWADVSGGRLRAIEANMKDCPDLVPTIAAVAMVAAGRTRIRGVPHLRVKESDRIAAIVKAVRALGGQARAFADGLEVIGGEVKPGIVDPMGDHRIAMAFAVLGLRRPGVRILTPEVVGKSFPDFFARLAAL